ncbi:THUMP domain-containing protein [Candidatus Bathyarchaeota archaeon]|nr:THUMP domain-containing protein [Candidatus Bathyarchaeota archaeon]
MMVSLSSDFNLIATTTRGLESEASSELWMLLRELGDENPSVGHAHVRGLILARTSLDPLEAVRLLKDELRRSPEDFRYLLRVIPVEMVVPTELDRIVEAAHQLASRIGEEETFRITVEKRRTELSSREAIEAVASGIKRRVDLENPDWIVLIEIVGRYTGVSVLRPDSILNVQKLKAESALNS